MIGNSTRPILLNFWDKVRKGADDECWLWTGAVLGFGHGFFAWKRLAPNRTMYAHRVMWVLANGRIPDGAVVCHHCDNPPCVNPAHLFIGTRADNNRDMRQKKRHQHGEAHWNAILTDESAREIKRLLMAGYTQLSIARRFGVSRSTVLAIHRGTTWAHVTEAA